MKNKQADDMIGIEKQIKKENRKQGIKVSKNFLSIFETFLCFIRITIQMKILKF